MIELYDLMPGDILIQYKGEPWVTGAKIFTGHPFPHSMMVSSVCGDRVSVIEASAMGVAERDFNVYDMFSTFPIDHYEAWRPKCNLGVTSMAIEWARDRIAAREGYGYLHLILILSTYRITGGNIIAGLDDLPEFDSRKKICSELIAMAYYRSGYDLVPHIADVNTMPWDLRNPSTCDLVSPKPN